MNQDTTNASVTAERPISRSAIISIRFQLVNPSRAESSLQCKIGVNGKYATEFVVERNIRTVNWAQKLQKMLDDSEESALLNQRLAFIKSEIKKAEMRLRLDGRPITAASIKNAYLEAQGVIKVEPKPVVIKRPTFHDCFREFYHKKSTQKRKPITERTRQSYWRYKNNLDKYMKFLQVKKLYADQITHEWAERYLDWLIDTAKFTNDYANNNIQLLKSVLQMAENSHLIDKNLLKGYKLFDNNFYDTAHLTITEVHNLVNADFSSLVIHEKTTQALREEADIFVFSCFTGFFLFSFLFVAGVRLGAWYRWRARTRLWLQSGPCSTRFQSRRLRFPIAQSLFYAPWFPRHQREEAAESVLPAGSLACSLKPRPGR